MCCRACVGVGRPCRVCPPAAAWGHSGLDPPALLSSVAPARYSIPRQVVATRLRHDRALAWPAYSPCTCAGACGPACACLAAEHFCHKFCACGVACASRWRGCDCRSGCRTRHCPCVAAGARAPPPPPAAGRRPRSRLQGRGRRRVARACSRGGRSTARALPALEIRVKKSYPTLCCAQEGDGQRAGAGMECDPDLCRGCAGGAGAAGAPAPAAAEAERGAPACGNMRLRLRQHKRVAMGVSDIAGWGAFLLVQPPLERLMPRRHARSMSTR